MVLSLTTKEEFLKSEYKYYKRVFNKYDYYKGVMIKFVNTCDNCKSHYWENCKKNCNCS